MIALLTDFGSGDYFPGVVKGVIRRIHPGADIIDLCHDAAPHSILNGQFILAASREYFPEGTIFYAVIDPGVGSSRRPLIAADERYTYVVPDNGLISAVEEPGMTFFEIDTSRFTNISTTFHGRDIFAPAAAMLARGDTPEKLGKEITDPVQAPWPHFFTAGKVTEAFIQHIDTFGNVITTVPSDAIPAAVLQVETVHGSFEALPVACYADIEEETIGAVPGSAGFIELAMDSRSLAGRMELSVGGRIVLRSS